MNYYWRRLHTICKGATIKMASPTPASPPRPGSLGPHGSISIADMDAGSVASLGSEMAAQSQFSMQSLHSLSLSLAGSANLNKTGGLVEEARKQYKGEYTDKTQWNQVTVGGSTHLMERGKVVHEKINLDDIKFTYAYEKKAHKTQCAFCRLYFEKSSVNFKVPNHRLVDKQREWSVPLGGRRYESASFLYSMSYICTFCAHIFDDAPKPKAIPDGSRVISPSKSLSGTASFEPDNANIDIQPPAAVSSRGIATSNIERSNVALDRRAYQSTVVDRMDASFAVTSDVASVSNPLNKSQTRREADPWWEVDFGMPQNLHSISFSIATGKQQVLKVSVLLLNGPIGHEDPFLKR
jgi:hypothetical protein